MRKETNRFPEAFTVHQRSLPARSARTSPSSFDPRSEIRCERTSRLAERWPTLQARRRSSKEKSNSV